MAKTFSFCVSLALEFAWAGSVAVNGKLYKAWSTLRPVLHAAFYSAHASVSVGDGDAAVPDLAQRLLDVVSCPVTSVVEGDEEEEATKRMALTLATPDALGDLKSFIAESLQLPLRMHDMANKILRQVLNNKSGVWAASAKVATLMELVGSTLFEVFKAEWVCFASDASTMTSLRDELPDLAKPLFATIQNLEHFLLLRPSYLVYVLTELIDGDGYINHVGSNVGKMLANVKRLPASQF